MYSTEDHVPELPPPEKCLSEQIVQEAPPQQALDRTYSNNAPSIYTTTTNLPEFEVDWEDDSDSHNPQKWTVWKKALTIAAVSWGTFCTVVYSTSYTTGIREMGHDFQVRSEPVITLGLTTYRRLLGEAVTTTLILIRTQSLVLRSVPWFSLLFRRCTAVDPFT